MSYRAGLEEMQRGIIDLLEDCVEVSDVYDPVLKAEERPGMQLVFFNRTIFSFCWIHIADFVLS